MDNYLHITGHEELRKYYGEELSFHDSEILTVLLDRGPQGPNEWSPSLTAVFHLFAWLPADPKTHLFSFHKHSLATIRFNGIYDLEMDGFNHQNAILELIINRLEDVGHAQRYSVCLDPAHGLGAKFICCSIELISFEKDLVGGKVPGGYKFNKDV
jgi:hypothetical protein